MARLRPEGRSVGKPNQVDPVEFGRAGVQNIKLRSYLHLSSGTTNT